MFDSEKVKNGEIGEQIINEHFSNSKRTDNWYDSEKDGTIGDESYEVKTIRYNKVFDGYLIDSSQYRKIDNVHHLFFVRVPEGISEEIEVYRCENHKTCFNYIRANGTVLRRYPKESCKLLFTINDERGKILYDNSIKMSKHKRHTQ